MAMDGLLVFVCALLTTAPPTATVAGPATKPQSQVDTALAVQNAMRLAGDYLQRGDARSAVLVLESQIARINGSRKYLELLASAYRKYVQDLSLSDRPAEARIYLERLCILEPEAAKDRALLAAASVSPNRQEAKPSAGPVKKGLTARAKGPEESTGPDDPFARAYEDKGPSVSLGGKRLAAAPETKRPYAEPSAGKQAAPRLVERAEAEFKKERYAEAHVLFEEAARADQKIAAKNRDQWAYCKLHDVVEQLNKSGADKLNLADLGREVRAAVEMSPRLDKTGKWLLQEIEARRNGAGAKTEKDAALEVAVQHLERPSAQGWRVAETPSFRILHHQSRDLVEKVGRLAEQTRQAMQKKWFARAGADWDPKCTLYLHANGKEYQHFTGVAASSPGHSRMETDGDRVISRRIDLRCDNPAMLTSVLPHETTHVVLAGRFGKHVVPRWADEGMAVLTEPRAKVELHRKNLARCREDGLLFTVRDLMSLEDYPQPRRVAAFYAQSVSLVEFLARERGAVAFSQFLREALQDGYEPALRKHYSFRSFDDLQESWSRQAFGTPITRAAGKNSQGQ
jgi:hypothetical protein